MQIGGGHAKKERECRENEGYAERGGGCAKRGITTVIPQELGYVKNVNLKFSQENMPDCK